LNGISDNRIKANDNRVQKEVGGTGPVKKQNKQPKQSATNKADKNCQ